MNVLSLFDGMSCGQIAFDKLGIRFDGVNNKYFASEIKKHAIKVTKNNYQVVFYCSLSFSHFQVKNILD